MKAEIERSIFSRFARQAQQPSRCFCPLLAGFALSSPSKKANSSSSDGCEASRNQFLLRQFLLPRLFMQFSCNLLDPSAQESVDAGNADAEHFSNLSITQSFSP